MDKNGCVIAISRIYGAGGREIGEILSKKLNIRYLDKELLRLAAENSGISESFFHVADERPGENWLYKTMKSLTPELGKPVVGKDMLKDENLFRYQSEIIKKLSESEEPCIIVGRCAGHVLQDYENLFRVFIYADTASRIERIVRRTGYNEEEARKAIKKIDRERKEYYNYYTGMDWKDMSQYDLCIDSGKLGAEKCADLIISYLKIAGRI